MEKTSIHPSSVVLILEGQSYDFTVSLRICFLNSNNNLFDSKGMIIFKKSDCKVIIKDRYYMSRTSWLMLLCCLYLTSTEDASIKHNSIIYSLLNLCYFDNISFCLNFFVVEYFFRYSWVYELFIVFFYGQFIKMFHCCYFGCY